jgi:tetratricopeptide (TPR) repeat protein
MGLNIDPNAPSPTARGKKYKLCCYLKKEESPAKGGDYSFLKLPSVNANSVYTSLIDSPEDLRLFKEGLRLMKNYEFNAAIPLFRKVSASSREFYSPDNNLALCLFATGRLDEAIKVQNESIEHTLLPNPFGLCNLSTFHYIKGDEIRSRRFLDMAIETEMPSEDACVKVCEVLARFQLHQKILDFVNTTEY